MLKGLKAQIVASEAQRAIALQDARVPDFDVGVQVGRSMPGDMGYVGGMVGINLPWLAAGRYQQRADEASQSVAIQQARWRAQESDTRLRIRERLDQLEQSRKQVELARRMLVPQSQQAINAALGAYRVNKADFTTVLEAEKALFETQMDSITALGEYHKTWAMLEEEVGVPIDLPKEETR